MWDYLWPYYNTNANYASGLAQNNTSMWNQAAQNAANLAMNQNNVGLGYYQTDANLYGNMYGVNEDYAKAQLAQQTAQQQMGSNERTAGIAALPALQHEGWKRALSQNMTPYLKQMMSSINGMLPGMMSGGGTSDTVNLPNGQLSNASDIARQRNQAVGQTYAQRDAMANDMMNASPMRGGAFGSAQLQQQLAQNKMNAANRATDISWMLPNQLRQQNMQSMVAAGQNLEAQRANKAQEQIGRQRNMVGLVTPMFGSVASMIG